MLEMKNECETCAAPLNTDGPAFICSYACTFCGPCTGKVHKGVCPNCGSELVARPKRTSGGG